MFQSNFKTPRISDKNHLVFIRTLPCVRTGRKTVQAAHIRMGTNGGMGMKPGDNFSLPLDYREHERQHRIGESQYWPDIDAVIQLANALYENTGNRQVCEKLILEFRIRNNSSLL